MSLVPHHTLVMFFMLLYTLGKSSCILTNSIDITDLEQNPLGIKASPHQLNEYVLSNRFQTHWTSDTFKTESRKWQGMSTRGFNTLLNFWLDTDMSIETKSTDIVSTTVLPFAIVHRYQHCTETAWMPLGKDALVIRYDVFEPGTFYFRPVIGMRKDWDSNVGPFNMTFYDHTVPNQPILFVSTMASHYTGPSFLGFGASDSGKFMKSQSYPQRTYPRDAYRDDLDPLAVHQVYQPGKIAFQMTPDKPFYIVCATADTIDDVNDMIHNLSILQDQTLMEFMDHIQSKVNELGIQTNSAWLDKAIQWSLVTVDSLTMNITGVGIYAGLHWFTQYWGRDSFISLPGALLTVGDFELAKQFILTMAFAQDINFNSYAYGRVPNVLQPVDEGANNYETADGTGYWIRGIWQLFEYGGIDMNFLTTVWPYIETAMRGEMMRADDLGFLKHGDRETWMDASVNGIPVTKRGSRAVEIQALYYTELDIAFRLATILNLNDQASKYKNAMLKVRQAFLTYFWNEKDDDLYDHLNADGTPGLQKRPNAIFAITIPLKDNPLLPPEMAQKVFASIKRNRIIAEHGIRTLSPYDSQYRKTHDETGQNHDFSYHNGDVWPWLTGAVLEAALYLNEIDIAEQLLQVFILRTLTIDTLGSIEEILDGTLPASANPFLGTSRGAMSQAWSVSEFIRTVHQGWLGVRPSFASGRMIESTLQLPRDINHASINTSLGEGKGTIHISYNRTDGYKMTLAYQNMQKPFQWVVKTRSVTSNVPKAIKHEQSLISWNRLNIIGNTTWFQAVIPVDVQSPNRAQVQIVIPVI